MSYVSVQVGGYFSAQTRAEGAIHKTTRSVLTFLTRAMTQRLDVYIAVERYDAEITARDNDRNKIAKLLEVEQATA